MTYYANVLIVYRLQQVITVIKGKHITKYLFSLVPHRLQAPSSSVLSSSSAWSGPESPLKGVRLLSSRLLLLIKNICNDQVEGVRQAGNMLARGKPAQLQHNFYIMLIEL